MPEPWELPVEKPQQPDTSKPQTPWELSQEAEMQQPAAPEPTTPIEQATQKEPWELSVANTDIGRFHSAINGAVKTLWTSLAGLPESVAVLNKKIRDLSPFIEESAKHRPITESDQYQYGQLVRRLAEESFPENPEYQDEFVAGTLAHGAGFLASMYAGGLFGKGLKIAPWLISAVIGGTSQASDEFRAAYNETGDFDTAFETWAWNVPIGVSDAVPVGMAFKRINKLTGGTLGRVLLKSAAGGLEEAIQETFQQIASNFTARQLYDMHRDLMDGAAEGGAAGFILGMAANALGLSLKRLRTKAAGVTEAERELVTKVESGKAELSEVKDYFERKPHRAKIVSLELLEKADAMQPGAERQKLEKAVDVIEQTVAPSLTTDEAIKASETSKKSKEVEQALQQWAESQIDGDEWLAWLEEAQDRPPAFSDVLDAAELERPLKAVPPFSSQHNIGLDRKLEAVNETVPADATEETADAIFRKPYRIKRAAQRVLFPEWVLSRRIKTALKQKGLKGRALEQAYMDLASEDEAIRYSVEISQKQLEMIQNEKEYEAWWNSLKHGLSKDELKLVRPLVDLAYDLRNSKLPHKIAEARAQLKQMLKEHPKLAKVLKGIDERGGIIELFEHVKRRYRNSLRERFRNDLDPTLYRMFQDVVDNNLPMSEVIANIQGLEDMALARFVQQKTAKGKSVLEARELWIRSEKTRTRSIKSLQKLFEKKLAATVREYEEISNWGIKDFQTKIELGNYVIRHPITGKRLGNARTKAEAYKKARALRQKLRAEGEDIGLLEVKEDFSRIKPTAQRKDILAGEENIFESLPRYIHAMEKRIIFAPLSDNLKRSYKDNPEMFTPDVQAILQRQMDAAMGNVYDWLDYYGDEFASAFGLEQGVTKKVVRVSRKAEAVTKLGYRGIAAGVNRLSGHAMTYVKTGLEFYLKGKDALKTGIYTDPEGNVIDLKKRLQEIEDKSQLGVGFAVEDDGTIKTGTPIWHPLWAFQKQEPPIREHAYVANYIMGREKYGLNDEKAHWLALQGVRFQQATYNTAAIPEILRSSTGRLVGQFKAAMINHFQFWASLSRPELLRMIEMQLMLAGPRGMIYLLRSMPFLGAFGMLHWLDDIEQWMMTSDSPLAAMSRGIGGLLGADVSAAATFQFPNRTEDWLGPTLSDMYKLYKDVLSPGAKALFANIEGEPQNAPAYIPEAALDWVTDFPLFMHYWKEIGKSVLYWEVEKDFLKDGLPAGTEKLLHNLMMPNVWIMDSNGNKAYQIGGLWDRALLLMGASPVERVRFKALKRIWDRNSKIRIENRRKVVARLIRALNKGDDLTTIKEDLILYGVDPNSIVDRLKWSKMTPEQRVVWRTRLMERAEALDHFGF